jgi:PIN domain nuclease of toxin-antitoxin system
LSSRFLLDTHIFIWWADEPARLSRPIREILEAPENDLYLSVASAWEIAIKEAVGKLSLGASIAYAIDTAGVELLPISLSHIERTKQLPLLHRDPFDRMLVAQAIEEELQLITIDRDLSRYGVRIAPA